MSNDSRTASSADVSAHKVLARNLCPRLSYTASKDLSQLGHLSCSETPRFAALLTNWNAQRSERRPIKFRPLWEIKSRRFDLIIALCSNGWWRCLDVVSFVFLMVEVRIWLCCVALVKILWWHEIVSTRMAAIRIIAGKFTVQNVGI